MNKIKRNNKDQIEEEEIDKKILNDKAE